MQDFVNGQSVANSDSIIVFRPLPACGEVPVSLPSLAASDQVYPSVSDFNPIRPPIPLQDPFFILRNSITFRFPSE